MRLDKKNGDTGWKYCTQLELDNYNEYKSFRDQGKTSKVPDGYKTIRTHLVYAIKNN